VRVYTVQRQGETAASIAAQPDMAQCPRCGKDLVAANPWRASVRRPNGYLDFRDPLVPGERLWVPDKWSSGELDALPKSYFDSLPDPTGLAGVPMQSQAIMLRPHPIVRYGVGDVPAAPAPSPLGQMLAKLPSYWPFVGLAAGGVMALTGVALLASGRPAAATNPRGKSPSFAVIKPVYGARAVGDMKSGERYVAKGLGEVTSKRSLAWRGTKAGAERIADEEGGRVVEL
jgi:hypothetical protein